MKYALVLILAAACSKAEKSGSPAPAPSAAPTAAPAPTPTPAPGAAPATDPLAQSVGAWMLKMADAIDASGGDCDKLASGLEPLAPEAKALKAQMTTAGKKLGDFPPDPAFMTRMQNLKDPELLDKCEKNPRVAAALDATILTLAPLGEDPELAKGFAEALGKATAVK